MSDLLPTPRRTLCAEAEVPEGGARGFRPAPGGFTGLFAVRHGGVLRLYLNTCPHIGTPLDWAPNRFLSQDGQRIICATHGAEFAPETGMCLRGPCEGQSLEAIPFSIEDGKILVAADAGL